MPETAHGLQDTKGTVGDGMPFRVIDVSDRDEILDELTSPLVPRQMRLLSWSGAEDAVPVWRPVRAERLTGNRYVITGIAPDGETWEFASGSVVRCEERVFASGERRLVAVEIVSSAG